MNFHPTPGDPGHPDQSFGDSMFPSATLDCAHHEPKLENHLSRLLPNVVQTK